MFFVEILNNYRIYQKNARLIENGLLSRKINIKQRDQLNIDNNKWFETFNHKGLFFIENNKYYFVIRTSTNNKLELPNNYQSMQTSVRQYAQPIVFNKNCNIMNKKWLLGNEHTNKVKYQSLEDKPDIICKLVGSNDDLSNLKHLVKKLDLNDYDITPYFNIEKTIDELEHFNIGEIVNTIRDE